MSAAPLPRQAGGHVLVRASLLFSLLLLLWGSTSTMAAVDADGGQCYNTMEGAGVDSGCFADDPICFNRTQMITWEGSGDVCVRCIDSHSGGSTDDGCEGAMDMFFGDRAAHICVDGGMSDGDYEKGTSLRPALWFFANHEFAPCAPCIDSNKGTNTDDGCPADRPFCVDLAAEDSNSFQNNGDYRLGLLCAECVNNHAEGEAGWRDEGCPPDTPYCYSYRRWYYDKIYGFTFARTIPPTPNEPGLCAACVDTEFEDQVDQGCSPDNPICTHDTQTNSPLLDFMPTEITRRCAKCVDDNGYTGTDSGCKNVMDDVYGTLPAQMCFTTAYSYGSQLGGVPASLPAFGIDTLGSCAPCIDDSNGNLWDTGCGGTHWFCADVGDEEHNMFINNRDYGRGLLCAECVDNYESAASTDSGCEGTTPLCYSYRRLHYTNKLGYEGLTVNMTDSEPGFCVACIDTDNGTEVDAGCTEDNPFCAVVLQTESVLIPGFFTEQTHACFKCKDEILSDVDRGCTEGAPFCSDVDVSTGYGTYCAYRNPGCLFDNVLPDDGALCPTSYKIDVTFNATLANCTTFSLDLSQFKSLLADALEMTKCTIHATSGDQPQNVDRRLLDSTTDIVLRLSVFVENTLQGVTLRDLLTSPAGQAIVAGIIEQLLGTATSINVEAVMNQILASVVSDPHFTTASGQKFDFDGVAGQSYCILTDKQVQVGAHFMGPAPERGVETGSPPDGRTWMDQISIMHGSDRVLIEAKSAPGTGYAVSFGTVRINGELLTGRTARKRLPSGITVSRSKTRVLISVPGLLAAEVEVVRAAFWEAGAGPGANFLNLQIKQFSGTAAVHGILGQSYGRQSEGAPIEGSAENYATTGIFATDCHFNQFVSNA